jgi:cytochrome c nitrite reductase small subunit
MVPGRVVGVLAVLVGVAAGTGLFTFGYAKGASYLGHDAGACANCHVMEEQYSAWQRGSHRSVAVCNDCHTPPGLLPKYATKAINGWNHSLAFTTGRFPEPIRITRRNRDVTERACRHCHESVVQAIDAHASRPGAAGPERLSCISCHRDVGHLH